MSKIITVVGVGALGSHLVQFLRNVDGELRVIDFDRIDSKNVMSQFHGKPNLGKGKADSLKQTVNYLFGVKIHSIPHKLTSVNDDQLMGKSDLIIDCLDNGEARRIVQGFARRSHTPCLHGALAANGEFGRVVWDENFVIDEAGVGAATCEDGQHLPFIALTSAFLAQAAKMFLTAGKKMGFEVSPAGVMRT